MPSPIFSTPNTVSDNLLRTVKAQAHSRRVCLNILNEIEAKANAERRSRRVCYNYLYSFDPTGEKEIARERNQNERNRLV